MRTRLCRLSATHAELKRAARAELERLNGKREPDSTPRMKKITSAKYGTGFVFYGPELELANIFNGVNALSGNGTVEDNGAALLKLIDAGGCRTEYSAVVGITLDELTRIEGSGEEEVALIASDGARMTGAEFVRRTLAGRGYVVLVDPVAGPVNLYEVRAASAKQRTMLAALWPRCEEPRCSVPASRCHVHHLHSYHHGGQTNIDNLGMLCKYHNGTNDDNPHAPPRRGRVEHRGLVSYKRWPSGTVEPDRSESMANRLLREIAAQAGSVRDLSA